MAHGIINYRGTWYIYEHIQTGFVAVHLIEMSEGTVP